ncbi:MAG: hypothetical protein WBK09_03275 [Limnohabitans sp.]|uniref:hypothetical protein n=1 Tax=Limnohabitans sp. TaxID=1907725 RepID=UPI003BAE8432
MREHLTPWDYVPEFTGQQAALAIIGQPPSDDPENLTRTLPVLELMRRAYEGTRRWFANAPGDADTAPRGLLVSVEMQAARGRTTEDLAAAGAGDVRFMTWLRTPMADFDRQHFAPDVLARWVQEVGASSLYPFAGPLAQSINTPKPMQRQRAQELAILEAIRQAGHDPLRLPMNKSGKPEIKAQVRKALNDDPMFAGTTVFKKAWERLSASGDIAFTD